MQHRARRGRPTLRRAGDLSGPRRYQAHLLVSTGDTGADDRHRRRGRNVDHGGAHMTLLAPLITGFLRDYMPRQRGYSSHSCEAYAYSFRLLFAFAAKRIGTRPSQLLIEQLDAPLILDFLGHIEQERGNGATTRNLRLAAIKTFMRYVEYQVPSALEQIGQIHAIPTKSRSEAHPSFGHGGGARNPECAGPHEAARDTRSSDDAPVLCRWAARLGIGRGHGREFVSAADAKPSGQGQGSEGAMPSALEGNRRRFTCLAHGTR